MNAFACRACGARAIVPILDLGKMPLANSLRTVEERDCPEEFYPLQLVLCTQCSLVQITTTVPPEKLFRHYLYFSSFSDTVLDNARSVVTQMIERLNLGSESLAGEIASNDGYLLQHYRERGIAVLGVEPARNIAQSARARGIDTVDEFFSADLARHFRAEGRSADVIHANNVLAHVADLHGVVAGLAAWLKPDGVAVIETPYVKDLLDHLEFDTIYHEHLCYYSLSALERLFDQHRLAVVDLQRLPIHGGSLRLFVQRSDLPRRPTAAVAQLRDEETGWGVADPVFYQSFGARVDRLKMRLLDCLRSLKAQGKSVAAYGASAKGTTLLNYVGIGREILDFVVDRSTVKQGRLTPGTHLPIRPPEMLLQERPDYVLLLTWNFADEILAQQAEYRRQGGRFILPVPEPRIV
jgi:predicted TPR repeat methyltransferase